MNMYTLSIIVYVICSALMILVGYTIKDAVRLVREFDQGLFEPYERDDEPSVLIGAWVGFINGEEHYVSFGSWDPQTDRDQYGINDDAIYYYTDGDMTLIDEGMTIGGLTVDLVTEWVWL